MPPRRTADDEYTGMMDVAARLARIAALTTSVVGLAAAAFALVAIAVVLMLSL